jgi:transcriptional regulator with XRE-family HTH domain
MTPPIVVVDPRFPGLLKHLRLRRRLSLRRFATLVNYSHTYLWELEVGRKRPTVQIAAVLDKALHADGNLAQRVTEQPAPAAEASGSHSALKPHPAMSPLAALALYRRDLESIHSAAPSAICKSVAKATKVRILHPPRPAGRAPDPVETRVRGRSR